MTAHQLLAALEAIPVELRDAEVWQCVIDGRMQTEEVRLYLPGRLNSREGTTLVLFPAFVSDNYPPADLVIVPGRVVS